MRHVALPLPCPLEAVSVGEKAVSIVRVRDGAQAARILVDGINAAVVVANSGAPAGILVLALNDGFLGCLNLTTCEFEKEWDGRGGPLADASFAAANPNPSLDSLVTSAVSLVKFLNGSRELVTGTTGGRLCLWPIDGPVASWGGTVRSLSGVAHGGRVAGIASLEGECFPTSGGSVGVVCRGTFIASFAGGEDGVCGQMIESQLAVSTAPFWFARGVSDGAVQAICSLPGGRLAILKEQSALILYQIWADWPLASQIARVVRHVKRSRHFARPRNLCARSVHR